MASSKKKGKHAKSEEDELETVYRKVTGYKGAYAKHKTQNRTPVIIAVTVALVAILLCTIAGYIYFQNADLDSIILENVTVAGIDVGGMSQAEAINVVKEATDNTYSKTPMIVTVLDSKAEIPVKHVGKLDVRGAVKAAYKFGNTGSQSKQQEERKIAMTTGYQVDLTPFLDINEKAIRQILADLGANYSSTLSQSTYEVTGDSPQQTLTITLGVPEYGLDLDLLYDQVLNAYSSNMFAVEGKCGMIEPDPIDLDRILAQYYIAPKDAYFDSKTQTVVDGIDGYGFDLESAKQQLSKAKFGSTVEIPFGPISPSLDSEYISSLLLRDELGTYTAASSSDKDRDTNLRLACEAINGLVLNPGDVFSYNEVLGERTLARGYRPGPSYSGYATVYTVGGGICQVSSALYYCVLQAELQVIMRTNHGLMPSYMPLGLDATVSWGSIDFRFKNNSSYPIRIDASASGGKTTVTIMGTDLRAYRVELESEVVSSTEYKTTYKTMRADNSEGYKNGDYITEPYTGYDIKTYLCKYEKDGQELLSRDFITQSVYQKRDAVICKIDGSAADNTASSGIGGAGITDAPGALPS